MSKIIIFENLGKISEVGGGLVDVVTFGLALVQTGSPSYLASRYNLCKATMCVLTWQ